MTQGTRKRTTEPILGTPILRTAILGTKQLQPVEWKGMAYYSSVGISGNIPRFVYVDLIGQMIQVILEWSVFYFIHIQFLPWLHVWLYVSHIWHTFSNNCMRAMTIIASCCLKHFIVTKDPQDLGAAYTLKHFLFARTLFSHKFARAWRRENKALVNNVFWKDLRKSMTNHINKFSWI